MSRDGTVMDFIHNSSQLLKVCLSWGSAKEIWEQPPLKNMSNKQLFKCVTTLLFIAGSKFKLKTSFTGSRTFQLNACIFMKHVPSIKCTHNISDVTHTFDQVWVKIWSRNAAPMCNLFPMGRTKINRRLPFNNHHETLFTLVHLPIKI